MWDRVPRAAGFSFCGTIVITLLADFFFVCPPGRSDGEPLFKSPEKNFQSTALAG